MGIGCGGGESRAVETVDGSGANIHARIAARGGRRRGLGCRDSSGAECCRPDEDGENSTFHGFIPYRRSIHRLCQWEVEIGRATGRERVCQYVWISVVAEE